MAQENLGGFWALEWPCQTFFCQINRNLKSNKNMKIYPNIFRKSDRNSKSGRGNIGQ